VARSELTGVVLSAEGPTIVIKTLNGDRIPILHGADPDTSRPRTEQWVIIIIYVSDGGFPQTLPPVCTIV